MGRESAAAPPTRELRAWRACVGAASVLGLAGAVGVWGLGWAVPVAGSCALVVGTAAVLDDAEHLRRAFRRTAEVTLVLIGAAGLVSAFALAGAALIGVFAVAWLFLPSSRDLEPVEPAHSRVPVVVPLPFEVVDCDTVAELDDARLCQAWRRSFRELETASPASRAEVVVRRQLYLDELERRHPRELQKWLTSGARAAGNPLRYLSAPASQVDDVQARPPEQEEPA